jgi:UDP-GlcNAc:undecaprenyl-phosphate GlcNAc-1-phosphate transferase
MKTYLTVYIGSVILAIMLTPIVIFAARALNIYDDLSARKVHARVIPRIGGIAIVMAMLGLVVPVLWLDNRIGNLFRQIQPQLLVMIGAGLFIFAVGLVDDISHLRARTKLFAQLVAAVVICAVGIRIDRVVVADWLSVELGWFAWPVTVFWIVAITNAVNLIDGLDGLAAGISAITCAVIAVFSMYIDQPVMVVLMLALLGSLSGFLFFNFNPARIFMGDCGSLFLGFMLAAASVMCTAKSTTIVGLALPSLALGIPIFDTIFSILRRFLERRSLFAPDRSHFHHRLLDMGLRHRHAVVLVYLVTAVIAGLGMFMIATKNMATIIVFFCLLVLLVLVFRLVGAVRLRETLARIQSKRAITLEAKDQQRNFEEAQLLLRRANNFAQWWQAVQNAAIQLDLAWIVMPHKSRSDIERTLMWRKNGPEPASHSLLETSLPVCQRRAGETLRISLAVQVDESLESASHRVALFGRLIDEHGLAQLTEQCKAVAGVDNQINQSIKDYSPQPVRRQDEYADLQKLAAQVSHG